MREYRKANPAVYGKEKAVGRARGRALVRLRKRYSADFYALLNEERATEGLPPVFSEPPGPKARSYA